MNCSGVSLILKNYNALFLNIPSMNRMKKEGRKVFTGATHATVGVPDKATKGMCRCRCSVKRGRCSETKLQRVCEEADVV